MKVHELIELLQTQDPEAIVLLATEGTDYDDHEEVRKTTELQVGYSSTMGGDGPVYYTQEEVHQWFAVCQPSQKITERTISNNYFKPTVKIFGRLDEVYWK